MAIVLWTAAVGFGLKENMGLLCALGALVPSPFWIIDAWYRQRERALMLRFKAIRDFLRDGRYMVKGENEATLQQFLDAEETSLFPVPDNWGSKTIPPKTLEVSCGLRHNLLDEDSGSIHTDVLCGRWPCRLPVDAWRPALRCRPSTPHQVQGRAPRYTSLRQCGTSRRGADLSYRWPNMCYFLALGAAGATGQCRRLR